MNMIKRFITVGVISVLAFGLSACHGGVYNNVGTENSSFSPADDDGGSGLMLRNGSIKPGVDMGGGFSMGYDGKIGYTFP